VVFGGELLAQTIVAGASTAPGKEVKSVHIVFARGAAIDAPSTIDTPIEGFWLNLSKRSFQFN